MLKRPMEALDQLLHTIRLRSVINSRVDLGEPWGVAFGPQPGAGKFHYIESGEAILEVPGIEPVRVFAGDFMVLPQGIGHIVRDRNASPAEDLMDILRRADIPCASGLNYRFGGGGARTQVISGKFLFQESDSHPLLRALPPLILIRGEEGTAVEWLDTTLGFLACEASSARPGSQAVLDRLCDVLFIQAVRGWIKHGDAESGFPAAIRDPLIAEALSLIHRRPAEPWTVASLADEVAMSRSAFAERFRRLVGESPMGYLTRWRMHDAASRLREGGESVAIVAERVGYESEAAFAKAFKRLMGNPPGTYRRLAVG